MSRPPKDWPKASLADCGREDGMVMTGCSKASDADQSNCLTLSEKSATTERRCGDVGSSISVTSLIGLGDVN
jgi:hypothetical protein